MNELSVAQQSDAKSGTIEVASTRAAQEVQAAMIVAKRFPRNTEAAFTRIMDSCKRKTLAENALYSYPKGGQEVTGPSIRLAEVLAQNWGNVDFGIIELEQRNGESTVMAYAWDLETNTRQTKVFQVAHKRDTKKGSYAVTDSRDIYELVANQGARRLRACILGIIPGDIVDSAKEACEATLSSGAAGPLIDRVRKMATAFNDMAVSVEMIENRLGHKLDATNETELVSLRKIYISLKDGMSGRDAWFGSSTVERAQVTLDLSQVAPGKVEDHTPVTQAQPVPSQAPAQAHMQSAIPASAATPAPAPEAPVAAAPAPAKRGRPAKPKPEAPITTPGPEDAEGQQILTAPPVVEPPPAPVAAPPVQKPVTPPQTPPPAPAPAAPAPTAAPVAEASEELIDVSVVLERVVYLGNDVLKLVTMEMDNYYTNAMAQEKDEDGKKKARERFEFLAKDKKEIYLRYNVDAKGRCLVREWAVK